MLARTIAADLLQIGAVSLAPHTPFTWASGLKSPIYCDNRLTLAYPALRGRIAEGFVACLAQENWDAEVIVGTATAGIPHAAWIAERMEKPMAYVRSKPKAHGRKNQIEGRIPDGAKTVIIEDLISTGGSSAKAVEAVQAAGAQVLGVMAIFAYGFVRADQRFAQCGVPYRTLTTFSTLLEVAVDMAHIAPDDVALLQAWQRDPQGWSARFESANP